MKKDWKVNSEISFTQHKNYRKLKKPVPLYMRIIIAFIIFWIVYTFLSMFFPDMATYFATIISVFLGLVSFVITSYNAHRAELYNKISNGKNKDENNKKK